LIHIRHRRRRTGQINFRFVASVKKRQADG